MTCEACNAEFEPKKPNQKVCSAKCRKEKWRQAHAQGQPESRALVPEVDDSDDDAPGKVGAPIKLTPSVQKTVCEMVQAGNYLKVACAAAGISEDTLSRWRKKGAAGQEPFATFARELQQAELDCESALVKKWHDAAPADWRAARDLLARRFSDRWGRQIEDEPSGFPGGLNIIIDLSGSPDDWDQRQAIPEVSEGVARAIEGAAPGTKV